MQSAMNSIKNSIKEMEGKRLVSPALAIHSGNLLPTFQGDQTSSHFWATGITQSTRMLALVLGSVSGTL